MSFIGGRTKLIASVTPLDASTNTITLATENEARHALTIYNDATKALHVKYGSGASSSSYSVMVPSKGYLEIPAVYDGILTGFWAVGAIGKAMITEFST